MSGGQIKVPLLLRAPTGAGVQLAATHSQAFETWLAEVPGMYCVCPSTPYDALGLIRTALKEQNPVMFAEPALLYGTRGEVPDEYYEIPFGSARVQREGKDVTLVSYGAGMRAINTAADQLAAKGVQAEVIDLRSLNPVDMGTLLTSVEKTNRVLLLDTARRRGGVMAEIASDLQEQAMEWLDGPAVRVGAEDVPWPYNRGLEQESYPQPEDVVEALSKHYGL
jgi:pyruvate dehydrogenase E1 component beta subunit